MVLSRDKSLDEAGERKGGAFLTGKCLALRALCLEKREPRGDCCGGGSALCALGGGEERCIPGGG